MSSRQLDNPKETAQEISEEKERQRLIKFINEAKSLNDLAQCKSSCTSEELMEMYESKEKQLSHLFEKPVDNGGSTPV